MAITLLYGCCQVEACVADLPAAFGSASPSEIDISELDSPRRKSPIGFDILLEGTEPLPGE